MGTIEKSPLAKLKEDITPLLTRPGSSLHVDRTDQVRGIFGDGPIKIPRSLALALAEGLRPKDHDDRNGRSTVRRIECSPLGKIAAEVSARLTHAGRVRVEVGSIA